MTPAVRRFGLISDTHGRLHRDVFRLFGGVEAILHAGDVVGDDVLDELGLIAATYAVAGNCDRASARLPLRRTVELPFGAAALAHGHIASGSSLPERLRHLVVSLPAPKPRLLLTGHTHVAHEETIDGVLVVNPGAACPPRFRTTASVAVLEWEPTTDSLQVILHPLAW